MNSLFLWQWPPPPPPPLSSKAIEPSLKTLPKSSKTTKMKPISLIQIIKNQSLTLLLSSIITVSIYSSSLFPIVNCINNHPNNNPHISLLTTPSSIVDHRYHHSQHHSHQQSMIKSNFENAYKDIINNDLRTLFLRQHFNFDVFFRQILTISHSDFHRMFSETYGILYDRHSYIFNELFYNLEYYYNNGKINLDKIMEEFFNQLYKKIFEELNTQYVFDDRYLNCTVEHMEEMMPFGELPKKLIIQIRRSFIAIRTFVQSLSYCSDILKTIAELSISSTCENHLKSIGYCYNNSPCHSSSINKICQSTCIEHIESACLYNQNNYNFQLNNLNKEWNKYLNDMIRLASRLKTSFNIEHIVSPIHIQISDAIMNFQENGRTISQRLFNKCGRPTAHRKREKRHELSEFQNNNGDKRFHHQNYSPQKPQQPQQHLIMNPYQSMNHQISRQSSSSSQQQHQQQPQQQNIDSIIDSMTAEFKTLKNFWSNLPKKLCSNYNNNMNCISNQTIRNSNEQQNYRDRNNVEIINQQISTLNLISFNLNKAYNGLDVDFDSNSDQADNGAPIDDELADDGSGFHESSGHQNIDDDDNSNEGSGSTINQQQSSSIFNENSFDNIDTNNHNNRMNQSTNSDIRFDDQSESSTISSPSTTSKILTLDVAKTITSSSRSTTLIINDIDQMLFWLMFHVSILLLM